MDEIPRGDLTDFTTFKSPSTDMLSTMDIRHYTLYSGLLAFNKFYGPLTRSKTPPC